MGNDISPSAPAPSISSAPTMNVVYGVVVGMLSALITSILKHFFGEIPPEVVSGIPVLVGFAVAYLVPLTRQEVANRVTNPVVKLANADADNPTTAKVVPEDESDKETQKDVALGIVPDHLVAKLPGAA